MFCLHIIYRITFWMIKIGRMELEIGDTFLLYLYNQTIFTRKVYITIQSLILDQTKNGCAWGKMQYRNPIIWHELIFINIQYKCILTLRNMMVEFNTYLYLQPVRIIVFTLLHWHLNSWKNGNWTLYVYAQRDCVLKHTELFDQYGLS